jgi:hypothetical protein
MVHFLPRAGGKMSVGEVVEIVRIVAGNGAWVAVSLLVLIYVLLNCQFDVTINIDFKNVKI